MKAQVWWLLAGSVVVVLVGYAVALAVSCNALETRELYCPEFSRFSGYYAENLRGHLFAGFLALGGFLLSLKTFIVVTMKDKLYDNEKYIANWKNQKKIDPALKLYGPLRQLSDFLYYAILASILSAGLQMSLGLVDHWTAAAISIWSAIYATFLLAWCLVLIKQNLDTWFSHLEHE